ncbi:MAG: redoxin domain-containing protein [Gammaproteobacteria bacterium]|nr:redoxin domain-containing protein [Gammaproteobacteria bacterium]
MKMLLSFFGLLVIPFNFVGLQMMADTGLKPDEFLITGKLVDLSDSPSHDRDLNVKVTYGTEETGIEELVSGKLRNGKFELRGTLEVPKDVLLSVSNDDDLYGVTQFKLCPNTMTRVEVIVDTVYTTGYTSRFDNWPKKIGTDHTYVYLKEYDHSSTDSERKFTFTGDLSKSFDYHPELTSVWVEGTTYDLDGSELHTSYGPVLLDKGKFSIEGDINGPMGVYILLESRILSDQRDASLTAIFEPGVNYEIGTLEHSEGLVVLADREGFHSKLISDWESDPQHLKLLKQQTFVREQFETSLDSENGTNQEIESEIEEDEEPTEETPTSTFADTNPPADQCNHVDLSSVPDDTGTGLPFTTWQELSNKISERRIELILPFMKSDDLHLAWFAYLLSPLEWSRLSPLFSMMIHVDGISLYDASTYELDKQKLTVLEELATKFSPAFVTVHITPRIESARQRISMYEENQKVIPGQPAPPFTLWTKDADSVSLHSVLQENELVLVNFWPQWCRPCDASIPVLKELYSSYNDKGFEIITVQLNRNTDSSIESFEENEFPWIDVIDSDKFQGDLNGWRAPIATSYAAPSRGIIHDTAFRAEPNGFLIDSEGCIVQRDLSTEELKSTLASRWSEESTK